MRLEPTVSMSHVRVLLESLDGTGVKGADVCHSCGIDPGLLEDPNARLGRSRILALWRELARRVDDPNPGLHLAERVRPRAANVVTYLMMSSRTLREGLERLIRYQRILGENSRVQLKDEGSEAFIEVDFGSEELPPDRHEIEYWVVVIAKYCAFITDLELDLLEVRFRHAAPADVSEHERIFGTRPRFGAETCGLRIASSDLDRRSVHANPAIAEAHQAFADEYLSSLDVASTTRRLRELMVSVIEKGPLELQALAKQLRISARTLQRRLADEDTSYREVVDDLRRDIALDQLRRTDAPIQEIAYLTGFSALSPFYRAFRRWTGGTPAEHRTAAERTKLL